MTQMSYVDVAMANVDDCDCSDHLIGYCSKAFRQLDDDCDDDELS